MPSAPCRPHFPIDLGPLPVDAVNAVLGTELEPGNVRLSETAHRHMAEDHPDNYAICIASLPYTIAEPSFIGQAPQHTSNFELLRRDEPSGSQVRAGGGRIGDGPERRISRAELLSGGGRDSG